MKTFQSLFNRGNPKRRRNANLGVERLEERAMLHSGLHGGSLHNAFQAPEIKASFQPAVQPAVSLVTPPAADENGWTAGMATLQASDPGSPEIILGHDVNATIDGINIDENAALIGGIVAPPDPAAAVGQNHIISVVNRSVEVHTKTGTQLVSQSLATFFGSLSPQNIYDPKVIYDQYAGRYLITAMDASSTYYQQTSRFLVAVSGSSDPMGNWWLGAFNTLTTINGVNHFTDVPRVAVDQNAIYLAANIYDFNYYGFAGSRLWIASKAPFYSGGSSSLTVHNPSTLAGLPGQAFGLQPAHMFGTTPSGMGTFLVSSGWYDTAGNDYLSVIRVNNPLTAPTFTNTLVQLGNISADAYSLPTAPQQNSFYELDTNDRRVISAVWRDNALWVSNTVAPLSGPDAGQATAHWYKIDTSNLNSLTLADQGNVGGEDIAPGTYTFYPSLAVDATGNMGINFSASGPSIFAGAYYAGRRVGDAPGTVRAANTLRAGADSYLRAFGTFRNRWGDYSSVALDPADETTFWAFNQYALPRGTMDLYGDDGRWGTIIGSFKMDPGPPGEIHGYVWNDLNTDGVIDAGEAVIPGVTVYLDQNSNRQFDAGEPSTVTASDGHYAFAGLYEGVYAVGQVVPEGYEQTYPAVGTGGGDSGGGGSSTGLQLVGQWNQHNSQHADLWAEGNYVYLGHYDAFGGVDIIDISNPANPTLVTSWTGSAGGNQIKDVEVHNGIGYFASDNGSGVYVVDVTNPASPRELARITSAQNGWDSIHNLSVDGNYLYEVNTFDPQIHVFDISNPASPRYVRTLVSPSNEAVHGITARNGRLYTSVITGQGTTDIFDISNVASSAPLLGSFVSGSWTHTNWPSADGRYLAVAREEFGGDVKIWDVSNPQNVTLVSTIDAARFGIQGYSAHDPYIVGNRLYVSWYDAGVQMFDISDPANPVHLGGYDTYPGTADTFAGNWGVFPFLGPDRIVASDVQSGLFILSSQPSSFSGVSALTESDTTASNPGSFQFVAGGFLTSPSQERPMDIALAYLRENHDQFGLTAADLADVVVTDQYTSDHNGVTHIYLGQRLNGLDIVHTQINVNVTADGRVLSVGNRFVPDAAGKAKAAMAGLSAAEALGSLGRHLGLKLSKPLTMLSSFGGPTAETRFARGELSQDDISAKLVYEFADGEVKLAWKTLVRPPHSSDWLDLTVDAETGTVLRGSNRTSHATYNVYAAPVEHPEDGGRTSVVDPYDRQASPHGWHDTNGVAGAEYTDTRGNNVFAQDDIDGDDYGGTRPDGGSSLTFNYTLDLGQDPSTYRSASITNLFYWVNYLHDVHFQYGFDEASGNFQFRNYTNAGQGNDQVFADVQDGAGTNNAYFQTAPEGQAPRMTMLVFDMSAPARDSALDNGVVIHEYGHGISTRLTGGPSQIDVLTQTQSGGMGEGWSDFWALALTARPGDQATDARPIGTYVLGQPANGRGVRQYPYSTDMSINPLTYRAVQSDPEVHGVGTVWATVLWDLYWSFVQRYGYDANHISGTSGNNKMLQLVMDGLKLQPIEPTFLDARDAILQADQVNTGGANLDIIWQAFARRGMGYSANDGGSAASADVTEAFDMPPNIGGGGGDTGNTATGMHTIVLAAGEIREDVNFGNRQLLPTLSIADASITETDNGTVNVVFTVSLSAASTQPVSVQYATTDSTASAADYQGLTGTLTFAPGETTKTISVAVNGDAMDEDDETFQLQLSAATGANLGVSVATGTILDNDLPPSLSINSINLTEGNSGSQNASFTVVLSAASGRTVSVQYSTANGTATAGSDYQSATGTLTFSPGDTTKTIGVTVNGDTQVEANETFVVNLTNAVNAAIGSSQGVGTILDDETPPNLSINDVTVTEGHTGTANAVFTLTLSASYGSTISVQYATADRTATAGSDYTATSGTATFSPGQTSQTITVPVIGDRLFEADETFFVNLSNPVFATIVDGQGVGTILDDDVGPTLSISDVVVTEGQSGTRSASFKVKLSAASTQTITVQYATANGTATAGSDYQAKTGMLTFSPGQTSKSIAVPIVGDLLLEPDETLLINLTNPVNAQLADAQAVGTIRNDDAGLSISDVTVTEGNSGTTNATFTVSLSVATPFAVDVAYATANSTAKSGTDFLAASGTLRFAAGEVSKLVTVPVVGDLLNEANEVFFVNLSNAVNATVTDAQGIGTIANDDPLPGLSITDVAVVEGNSGITNAVFTVRLSAVSGQSVTVQYSTVDGTAVAGSDYLAATGAVVFNAGVTSRTITVPILGDTVFESNETFNVLLSSPVNATLADGQGSGTINNDDISLSFQSGSTAAAESEQLIGVQALARHGDLDELIGLLAQEQVRSRRQDA